MNIFFSQEAVPYIEGTEIDLNEEGELQAFNPNMSIIKISGTVSKRSPDTINNFNQVLNIPPIQNCSKKARVIFVGFYSRSNPCTF